MQAGQLTSQETEFMDLLRILLAVLLPPLGVFLQVGLGLHFWLNIVLTLLGYIPGLVHAIWIIARVGPRGASNGIRESTRLMPSIGRFAPVSNNLAVPRVDGTPAANTLRS